MKRTPLEFDVPRDQWPAFLEHFSRDHRSWLATVERSHASGGSDVIVRELPLAGVTVDDAGGVARAIHIAFAGDEEARPRRIEVPDPIALRLVEIPGRVPSLEIHQMDGACTRLRFRDVPLPNLLDGIARGEVEPFDATGASPP